MGIATVTGPIYGASFVDSFVDMNLIFELSHWEQEEDVGTFVSGPIMIPVTSDGDFSVDLYVNGDGINTSHYKVYAEYTKTDFLRKREYLGYFSLTDTGTVRLDQLNIITDQEVRSGLDVYGLILNHLESSQAIQDSITTMHFNTRSELEAYTLPDSVTHVSCIHPPVPARNAMLCTFVEMPDESATPAVTDAAGRKLYPSDDVTFFHWGAYGDGDLDESNETYTGTNDDTAVQNTIAYAMKYDADIHMKRGKYIITSELELTDFDFHLIGEGVANSVIMSNALTGHVISSQKSGVRFMNFAVTSLPGRYALSFSNTTNGVHLEDVEGGDSGSRLFLDNIQVTRQPGHGVYALHAASLFRQVFSNHNKGHGFCMDGGQGIDRVDLTFKGWNTLELCRAEYNGGNGYAVGSPTSEPGTSNYRVIFSNCEGHANATDPNVRYLDVCHYVVAEQVSIDTCAAGGDGIKGGWALGGRHISVTNSRSLQCTVPYTLMSTAFSTHDVSISKCRVIGGDGITGDVIAVVIDPLLTADTGIDIDFSWMANVSEAVSGDGRAKVRRLVEGTKEYRFGSVYEDDWSDFGPVDITTKFGTPTITPNASNIYRKIQRGKRVDFTLDGSFGFTVNDASDEVYIELGTALGVTWNSLKDQTINVGRVFGITAPSGIYAETIGTDRVRLVANDIASGGVATVLKVSNIVNSSIQLSLTGSIAVD